MKAVAYRHSLPIENSHFLEDVELDKPTLKPRDLLVEVEAVSINPVDTKIRQRVDPEGDTKVLGWDAVGVVKQLGTAASLYKIGDRVWYAGAIDRQGTNSQYHAVDERIVGVCPTKVKVEEAAAMPLTTITAWELLFDRLQVNPSQSGNILIIGGAGGVGSILTQICKAKTRLKVIVTASRKETLDWCIEMGADHVINHRESISEQLEKLDLGKVDFVASLTHTDVHLEEIVESLRPQGKLALIDDPETLDISLLKQKSISLHWEFMYTRSLFETDDMEAQKSLLDEVSSLIDDGRIKSTLKQELGVINASNLMRAHKILESGTSIGKLVCKGF